MAAAAAVELTDVLERDLKDSLASEFLSAPPIVESPAGNLEV